jgi:hypothetical protein
MNLDLAELKASEGTEGGGSMSPQVASSSDRDNFDAGNYYDKDDSEKDLS